MALMLMLTSCATLSRQQGDIDQPPSIGPYSAFTGRLIVMGSGRRWQGLVTWRARAASSGWLRVTHSASGAVVELRWRSAAIDIRDNQRPGWRRIGQDKLSEMGIMLPPRQLASILLGKMPAHFKYKGHARWESRQTGSLVRLRWRQDARQLTLADPAHGRQATLIIQP
jgi:hypothetical protein